MPTLIPRWQYRLEPLSVRRITPCTQTRYVAASLLGTHNPHYEPATARRMTPGRAPQQHERHPS